VLNDGGAYFRRVCRAAESARGTTNPVFSMTEREDGRLEDVGGEKVRPCQGGQDEGNGWRARLVKYGENGRRKGRIECDRQVCKYCRPQLANVVSKAEGFGLS